MKPVIGDLIYTVSEQGSIIDIEGPWDDFSSGNGCEWLTRASVIGTNLFSHISGDETEYVYQAMHELIVHEPGKTIVFDYRCDSPYIKRDMRMKMTGCRDGVRYQSSIIDETLRLKPIHLDYSDAAGPYIVMCSWCKSFHLPNDSEWKPIEAIFSHIHEPFWISHGICPSCSDTLKETLGLSKLKQPLKAK